MRVILTGANGFIGGELLRDQKFSEKYEITTCETTDDIYALAEDSKRSILLHLSGRFSGTKNNLWDSNVELTRSFLNAFPSVEGRRVLFMSSGAVYGDILHDTGSVETDASKPTTFYGVTKFVAEMLLQHQWGLGQGRYHILRLPNVYGNDQKKGVIYSFQQQIQLHGAVKISGDGKQRRDFLHVEDLIRAIDLVIAYQGPSGIFNISSDLTLSVNEVADLVIGKQEIERFTVSDNNGLRNLILDYTKAQSLLGFKPQVNQLNIGV